MRNSRPIHFVRPMSARARWLVLEDPADVLPPCPAVQNGVAVKYMGTERRRIEGEVSGFVYYADPTRRRFDVDRRDLGMMLTLRAFVLAD